MRNPSREEPRAREGEQLPAAEIDKLLAEAATQAEVGNTTAQRNALRGCANKVPASARCDGEMGLAQIASKNRKATALYYLKEAATHDDPKADASLYLRVGRALRSHGKYAEASAALEFAFAREDSAEVSFELARTLSLQPARLSEATDFMAQARAKEDRFEWLYEEAVLRGQLPIAEQATQAATLFGLYLEQAKALPSGTKLPGELSAVAARAAELTELAKVLPSQVEVDAQQAAAKAAATEQQGGATAESPASPPK